LILLVLGTQKQGLGPEEVMADSPLYGNDEKSQKAKGLPFEVISPVIVKLQGNDFSLADFRLRHEAIDTACP
jgi:hypothetical protein